MRRLPRSRRALVAALGALAMACGLLAGPASAQSTNAPSASAQQVSAQSTYDPPDWDPPEGHNVSTVRWGPITIPAAENGQPGERWNQMAVDEDKGCGSFPQPYCIPLEMEKPCEDCYITGILPDLVYEGTNKSVNHANGGMLHHAVNINFSRPDTTCPPGPGSAINLLGMAMGGNQRFFATGNERTHDGASLTNSGGDTYGYYVAPGDKWGMIHHLMNHNSEPITVEYKYTVSWVRDAKRVAPVWLDGDQCGDSEFSIPTGYSDTKYSVPALRGGRVVAIGGHVHDYGISVSLENATTGEYICTSKAGYALGSQYKPVGPGKGTPGLPAKPHIVSDTGHPNAPLADYKGHIADMTTCDPSGPSASFEQGDMLRMHAQYNAPQASDHAMGIMVAFVDWND